MPWCEIPESKLIAPVADLVKLRLLVIGPSYIWFLKYAYGKIVLMYVCKYVMYVYSKRAWRKMRKMVQRTKNSNIKQYSLVAESSDVTYLSASRVCVLEKRGQATTEQSAVCL